MSQEQVGDNAQDQGAGNGGQGDLAEGDGEVADTGNEDHRDREEVLTLTQIHLLRHLQTADSDETVECHADTAHDAVGDGGQEGDEGAEEGDDEAHHSSAGDGDDRGVTGDGNAAHRLAVGGIGAAAEDSTGHGANAVAQEGTVQTGLFQQVAADDGGEVLVVGNVLSEDHEGNRHISNSQGGDEAAVDLLDAFHSLQEGEVGDCEDIQTLENGEVDDLQGHIVGIDADDGEDRSGAIANQDAQDKGDELHHLLAVDREDHNSEEGDKAAEQSDIGAAAGDHGSLVNDLTVIDDLSDRLHHNLALGQVADGVAGKRKADNSNSGSYDRSRHQLIDPLDANQLDHNGNYHVNKTGKHCANDQTSVTGGRRNSTAESCEHRTQESKRRTQINGAFELGKELIDQCTDTCTEESSGLAHAVTDNGGNRNGCRQNCQHLLERENQQLWEFRLVLDAVDEFHELTSSKDF